MSLVLLIIVVLILIALAVWAISLLTMIPATPRVLLQVLVILLGVYVIGQKAGLWA